MILEKTRSRFEAEKSRLSVPRIADYVKVMPPFKATLLAWTRVIYSQVVEMDIDWSQVHEL
jgi:hypothetical protein